MLETIGISVLLKAVEFLFGEGTEIIKARRKRQKSERNDTKIKSEDQIVTKETLAPENDDKAITSRESAINSRIDEDAWKNSRSNVEHLLNLIEIQTKNYFLAKEQYAKWGSTLVPPIIIHNLEEAETQILGAMQELQSVLSKIYGQKVKAIGNDAP